MSTTSPSRGKARTTRRGSDVRRAARRLVAGAVLALCLGGCVTDGLAPRTAKRDADDPDKPKQACEHTSVAGEAKTVCY